MFNKLQTKPHICHENRFFKPEGLTKSFSEVYIHTVVCSTKIRRKLG